MQIDWSQIETVLLDMDGTVLDLHFDNHFWRDYLPQVLADEQGLTLEQAVGELDPLFEGWAGTLKWYCVDHWSQHLQLDIMTLKRDVADRIAYRPKAEAFLQTCADATSDVRMITNGHRKVLDLKIEHTQIDRYFDQMICSHELDHPKEDQAFWQRLLEFSPFDPNKTLFIDDSEAVLKSAEKFGIGHIYSIARPDSKRLRDLPSKFPMIEEFEVSKEAESKVRNLG